MCFDEDGEMTDFVYILQYTYLVYAHTVTEKIAIKKKKIVIGVNTMVFFIFVSKLQYHY